MIYHAARRIQTTEVTPLLSILSSARRARPGWARPIGLVSCLALALAGGACSPPPPRVALNAHATAEWKGDDKELFGDSVDQGAFPPPGSPPLRDEANEARIVPRVDRADGVVVAKFVSVTSEPAGDKQRFRLELAADGQPLSGKAPPESPFVLVVDPDAPAFGTIRAQGDRLIGQKVVVYYRRYADDADTLRHRFHLSAVTPGLLKFIADYKTKKQFH